MNILTISVLAVLCVLFVISLFVFPKDEKKVEESFPDEPIKTGPEDLAMLGLSQQIAKDMYASPKVNLTVEDKKEGAVQEWGDTYYSYEFEPVDVPKKKVVQRKKPFKAKKKSKKKLSKRK